MLFGCSWSTQTLRPHLATSILWKERFQVEANHDASIGIKSNLKRRTRYRRLGKHGSGWAVYILVKAPLNIWISCTSLTWLFRRIAHLKPPKWVLFPTASETICLHKAGTCTFSQINKLKAFKLKNTHHSFPLQIRLRNYLYKVKQCYQTFKYSITVKLVFFWVNKHTRLFSLQSRTPVRVKPHLNLSALNDATNSLCPHLKRLPGHTELSSGTVNVLLC